MVNLLECIEHQRLSAAYADGIKLLQSGKINRAILQFQEAFFFAPNVVEPLIALAECYVCLCDLQSAVRLYRRALWVLQQTENKQMAYKLIQTQTLPQIKEKNRQSVDRLCTSLSTSNTTATSSVVNGIGVSGNTNDDKEQPSKWLNSNHSIGKKEITERLVSLLDALSLTLFRLSDFDQALRFVNEALELQSNELHPLLCLHKAVYLIALKEEEEAEFLLEKLQTKYMSECTQFAPLLIHLYCNRQAFRAARILLDKSFVSSDTVDRQSLTIARHLFTYRFRRYRTAAIARSDVKTISQCIEVYPNDIELLFLRAQLYIVAQEHKRSVRDLFKCIKETNGTHKAAMEMMTSVLFAMGATLNDDSGIHEAIAYYSESLKWRNDNTLVLLARGDCYVKIEDYERALADYKRVMSIDSDNQEAPMRIAKLHDLWGCKFYALHRLEDAEREFSNAIKEVDTEPVFYYHRALTRFALNEPRYGLRDVLSCKELHPSSQLLQSFLERFLGTRDTAMESEYHANKFMFPSRMHTHRFYHKSEGRTHNSPFNKSHITDTDTVKQTCLPALVEGKRACLSQRSSNKDAETRTTVTLTPSMEISM